MICYSMPLNHEKEKNIVLQSILKLVGKLYMVVTQLATHLK